MCPYAQKAWIALELSGCDYELEEISLYGPNGKPDSFLQLNPAGTVPVLVCGEDVVTDSEDILDYVSSGHVGRTWTGGEGEESTRWRNIVAEQLAPAGKRAVLGSGRNELFALLEGLDGGGGGALPVRRAALFRGLRRVPVRVENPRRVRASRRLRKTWVLAVDLQRKSEFSEDSAAIVVVVVVIKSIS
eukprot:CAMPEP_0194333540 /NCGR_PEP_ID=MMETSP0171-20130528/63040_1 /TAXON_ID=218684 /ORGANISM="Corethron pennatum, Strain L29A3" /LENGTH=188 /DNA_ID=CAMNT_0039095813 /DNA_START=130 /DNA_END=691 /DNA_ORIENTATION=-